MGVAFGLHIILATEMHTVKISDAVPVNLPYPVSYGCAVPLCAVNSSRRNLCLLNQLSTVSKTEREKEQEK